jgi:tetratricopeptide (TPR) repeat protein
LVAASIEDLRGRAREAFRKGDRLAALDQWTSLREAYPDCLDAYLEPGNILVSLRRFGEADQLLGDAVIRFPDGPAASVAYAMSAHHQRDWIEACQRWAEVCAKFPDHQEGFVRLGETLRVAQRFEEADEVLAQALTRFPEYPGLAAAFAQSAQARGHWDDAEKRWNAFRQRFPEHVAGWCGGAEVLRSAGKSDQAEELLEQTAERFGRDPKFLLQRALNATRRGDWPTAFDRWGHLKTSYPQMNLGAHIGELLTSWRFARGEGDPLALSAVPPPEFAALAGLEDSSGLQHGAALTGRELMMQFESLGDHCEFGLVQRHFGAEPLGLLRWSGISPHNLALAIAARFEGVGEANHTYVKLGAPGGEYFAGDKRWFFMHAFLRSSEFSEEQAFRKACQRLHYLRAKLLEDLEAGNKIFVYKKHRGELTEAELAELLGAFQSAFPRATLLVVRVGNSQHPPEHVEAISPYLLLGYIDKFSDQLAAEYISHDCWERMCRRAWSIAGAIARGDEAASNTLCEA